MEYLGTDKFSISNVLPWSFTYYNKIFTENCKNKSITMLKIL
jgi:hypothetical protein